MARDDVAYRSRVRAKYNGITSIWSDEDRWHSWSHGQVARAIRELGADPSRAARSELILDVGSAGETYGLIAGRRLDIDIAEKRLPESGWRVCGNAEYLPLADGIADLIICVGPVVNYCSLEEVVAELSRVGKPGARIVLHVELSNSWEFVGSDAYRTDAAFVQTFYQGSEWMWVYSDAFVRRVASNNGLRLERVRYFHIVSSLIYRLFGNPNVAAIAGPLDGILRRIPGIGQISDSAIYVFRREG